MKKIVKKSIGEMKKFSLAEMTSNDSGKTSASGTMGIYICLIGGLCFLLGCLDKMFINKDIDVITQAIIFTGIGAGLLRWRKHKDPGANVEKEEEIEIEEKKEKEIL